MGGVVTQDFGRVVFRINAEANELHVFLADQMLLKLCHVAADFAAVARTAGEEEGRHPDLAFEVIPADRPAATLGQLKIAHGTEVIVLGSSLTAWKKGREQEWQC